MRISDWSSDVCSSDLRRAGRDGCGVEQLPQPMLNARDDKRERCSLRECHGVATAAPGKLRGRENADVLAPDVVELDPLRRRICVENRSEEHTSELQSLMRISYAVFCLKKKKQLSQ